MELLGQTHADRSHAVWTAVVDAHGEERLVVECVDIARIQTATVV